MKKKALVVDNNKLILEIEKNFLEKHAYEVKTAENGLAALEVLTDFHPSIIFVDMIMPKINGEKLCRIIRSMPDFNKTHLVIVSAVAAEQLTNFRDFGATACIAKGPLKEMEKNFATVVAHIENNDVSPLLKEIIGADYLYKREVTKELLSIKSHYETALDSIADGFLELTADYKIIYANNAASRIFGVPDDKILTADFTSFFKGAQHKNLTALLKKFASGKQIGEQGDFSLNNKYLSLSLEPVGNNGQHTIIVIIHDITERKENEQKLRKYYAQLENTVSERTVELRKTNDELKTEVVKRNKSEKKLQQAHVELQQIFDTAGDGMLVIDKKFNITKANEAFAALCATSRDSTSGKKCFEVCPSIHCKKPTCCLTRILQGEERFECEGERALVNGKKIYCLVVTAAFRGHDGQLKGIVQNFKDITERKQAEKTLQEQKDFLQNSLDALTHPFYVIDANDYTIKLSNKASHFGEHVAGTTCYSLTHNRSEPCKGDEHPCTLEEVRKTGKPTVIEHIHHNQAQGESTYEVHAYPVFDSNGNISQVIEYCLDITERKRVEAERRRLVTAIEQGADSIVITDKDGTIEYVNPSFEQITGYSKEEAIGKNPRILQSGRHDRAFYKQMWETLACGRSWRGHLTNKRKDGTLFEEEASITPVFNENGEVRNYVAVKHDITEKIMLEQQLQQAQKMEAIGTLAGGIAHDFNNILAALLGFAELANLELPAESPASLNLAGVLKAGNRAKELVKQILEFSRQSAQEFKPLKIQFVIKEALKLLRSSIPTTIEIRQEIDTTCGPVLADPTKIHQVIMNLCTNAYHAMQERGGVLSVTLSQVEFRSADVLGEIDLKPGPYIRLEVSDTGCGIDPAFSEKIFDPYFTTKEKGKGTGLGLSVVHGIVKSHGGHISVHSEPNIGSTFRVFLPILLLDREVPEKIEFTDTPRGGTERILVIDDEEFLVHIEQKILERLGYKVTALTSSEQALQMFKEQPQHFHLVITDMAMPHSNGVELAQEMLAIRPDLPIILCTGFSELINKEKAMAMGVREFALKPIAQNELARLVRQVLDNDN